MKKPSSVLGKPLTEKQQVVWDLKQAGKTGPQIALELGIAEGTVRAHILAINRRLGRSTKENKLATTISATQAEDAIEQINAKMGSLGLPERFRVPHIRRLKVRRGLEETPLKPASDDEMKIRAREIIGLAFSYMDDKTLSEASFRDLSVGTTAIIEKLQLLEGKPTQIISDLERKNLIELMPLLISEARRRGITVEGEITQKVVNPA